MLLILVPLVACALSVGATATDPSASAPRRPEASVVVPAASPTTGGAASPRTISYTDCNSALQVTVDAEYGSSDEAHVVGLKVLNRRQLTCPLAALTGLEVPLGGRAAPVGLLTSRVRQLPTHPERMARTRMLSPKQAVYASLQLPGFTDDGRACASSRPTARLIVHFTLPHQRGRDILLMLPYAVNVCPSAHVLVLYPTAA